MDMCNDTLFKASIMTGNSLGFRGSIEIDGNLHDCLGHEFKWFEDGGIFAISAYNRGRLVNGRSKTSQDNPITSLALRDLEMVLTLTDCN